MIRDMELEPVEWVSLVVQALNNSNNNAED